MMLARAAGMPAICTQVTVLEHGAAPPSQWHMPEASRVDHAVLLAQHAGEDESCFAGRVGRRLAALTRGTHVITHARLVLSAETSRSLLLRRTKLARQIAAFLGHHPANYFVVTGRLTASLEGAADFWTLIEVLRAELASKPIVVKASPDGSTQPWAARWPQTPDSSLLVDVERLRSQSQV